MEEISASVPTNESLKLALEVSNSGIWDWDIPNDRFYWSEEFLQLFGMEPGITPGFDAWKATLFPDDLPHAMSRIQDSLEQGTDLNSEYRIVLPDGKIRWIRAAGRTFYENGKPARMLGLCTDITEQKLIQQSLVESERRFRLALKNAPVSVAAQDRDLRFIWAYNQRTVDPVYVIGKTDSDLFSPSDAAMLMELKRQVLDKGIEMRKQFWITSNGTKVYLDLYLEPLRDESGTVCGIGMATVDLTPMKLAEEALRKSEEKFKIITTNTPDHVLVQDTDLRYQQVINPQMGLTEEEMLGRTDHDFLSREDADKLTRIKKTVLDTGNPEHVQTSLVTRTGSVEYFEGAYIPKRDALDRIVGIIGYFRNVTKRKTAEAALLENEATMRGILNATSESIWLFDLNGVVLLANHTAARRIKMTPESVVGRSVSDLLSKELAEPRMAAIRKAAETGQPVGLEDIRSGFYFEHTFYPVSGHDGVVKRVVVFSRDITERKRWEQELRRSHAELEDLVKDRTSKLLQTNEILEKEIEERIRTENFLRESQNNLRALANRMHDIAEEERIRVAREIHDELGHLLTALKYDIEGLSASSCLKKESASHECESIKSMVDLLIDSVRKIATELRPGILDHLGLLPAIEWQIEQFRIRTKIIVESSISDMGIEFDMNKTTIIYRIFQEILTNIARHSKARKVFILVKNENNRFSLNVSDNGVGFKVNEISPVASLGLMGMRERALSIGAELRIESDPGKGTTVTLALDG